MPVAGMIKEGDQRLQQQLTRSRTHTISSSAIAVTSSAGGRHRARTRPAIVPMRAGLPLRRMDVVASFERPTAAIIADDELTRKGFEHYAAAAGIPVVPPARRRRSCFAGPNVGACGVPFLGPAR